MKNYYEVLGVGEDATQEEIRDAYYALAKKYHPNGNNASADPEKFMEACDAYEVLGKVENRKKYDKEMFNDAEDFEYGEDAKEIDSFDDIKKTKSKIKVSKNAPGFFKKHKYKLVTGALVVGGLIVGYLIGQGTNTPSQEPQSIVDTMDDENTTKTQEVEEKKLTAENFDQVVQDILTDNQSRGLNIDPTFIRSALFITNIDYLDQEDIKALYGGTDLNMIEEIQNMYNYTSAVGTHNNNLAFGNIDGSYISLANLAYDPEDKAVLHEMDVEFTDLVNDLNSKEMTSEEFQASFKYITEFYTGAGSVTTDGNSYSNYSMTSGGGLLSEQYWPMFSVIYASSEFITNENQIDIKSLSEGVDGHDAVVNGSKYLGGIINHESLNCLDEPVVEEDKTLTKTQ